MREAYADGFLAGALPQSISTPRKESGSLCPYVACVATHRGVSIGAKNVPERGGSLLPAMLPPARPAVFDFHQAVDGLQEVQRQAQEGKK